MIQNDNVYVLVYNVFLYNIVELIREKMSH